MFNFLVLIAIVLRLILMPISVHSDLFFINVFPHLLPSEKIFNISLYFDQNLQEKQYTYYSPLTYYTFAAFQFIDQFFSKSFSPWMQKMLDLQISDFKGQAADFIKAAPNPNIFKDLFLAKAPYLIFDLAAALAIFLAVNKRLLKKAAVLIWLFNPVSFYAIYIVGQFEIIPSFFVLLGFLFMRNNVYLGIVSLGIAAAYKSYAFLLIIPAVLVYGQSLVSRLKLLILGSLPYVIFLIPTMFSSLDQVIYAFLPKVYLHYRKPLEGWPLYSQVIKYTVLSVSLLFTFLLAHFLKIKDRYKLTLGLGLACLLLVYALAPRISFHYLLWATPLIILYFKNLKTAVFLIIIQAMSLASYKLLANHLQAGLFAPINPDLFSNIPPINSLIDQFIPYTIFSSIGYFVFFFVNLYFAAKIIAQFIFQEEVRQGRK